MIVSLETEALLLDRRRGTRLRGINCDISRQKNRSQGEEADDVEFAHARMPHN